VKKGYSILEVMVAVALLSIVLPGLVRWVTSSRKAQTGSFRSEQATEYAQYFLDSLRTLPRSARTTAPTTGVTRTKGGMTYTVKWNYVSASNYTDSLAGAAWVEVAWTVGGTSRTSRLDGVLP